MSDNTTATKGDTMLTVTYRVFEKDLNRTFENVKTVQTMADFRLFALAVCTAGIGKS